MELLVILSAILSALTGVVTGARVPDVQVQRCAVAGEAQAVAVAIAPRLAGHRHMLGGFGVRQAFATALPPIVTTAIARLYLDRPRA